MIRLLPASLLGLCLFLSACSSSDDPPASGGTGGKGGSGGAAAAGGSGGATTSGGTGGPAGGGGAGGAASGGAGGSAGGSGGHVGGASGGSGGAVVDAADSAPTRDAPATGDVPAGEARPGILSEGADYPGRPEVRICNKEWTHEQCCEFLCRCLNEICADAPKAKNGLASCGTWCPKLSNMAMRCHVYHCFESVSTGGKKDHDSHCGHAADQVPGGMCRPFVYE